MLARSFAAAVVVAVLTGPLSAPAAAQGAGLLRRESKLPVKDTIDKLAKAVEARGAKVVARVDHAAGAKAAGTEMKPMQLLIFGNPKLGSPLIQGNPRAGLELPMKVLAYEDAKGRTWVTWTAPASLKARYRLKGKPQNDAVKAMTAALDALIKEATAP